MFPPYYSAEFVTVFLMSQRMIFVRPPVSIRTVVPVNSRVRVVPAPVLGAGARVSAAENSRVRDVPVPVVGSDARASAAVNSRGRVVPPPVSGAGARASASMFLSDAMRSGELVSSQKRLGSVVSPSAPKRRRSLVGPDILSVAPESVDCDPLWGPRLRDFVCLSPLGSFQRSEFLKDAREGFAFAVFVRDRPWPRQPTGFLLEQQLDADATFFAAQHFGMVSSARRSISRYEEHYRANVHLMRFPDPYRVVSADVLEACVRNISAAAVVARGAADAGCSGSAFLDGLAAAHVLAGAPFPPELLKNRRVLAAASSPAPRPSPRSAHMPMSAMCLLEDIALGSYWASSRDGSFPWGEEVQNPFCVQTARSFVVMSLLSLRGVDALRSRVLPLISPRPALRGRKKSRLGSPSVPPASSTQRPVLRFSSRKAGAAGRRQKGGGSSLVEFDCFIPEAGFLPGVEQWLPEWSASLRGLPFIFRGFNSPRVGQPIGAFAWTDSSMSKPHLEKAWACLLSPLFDEADREVMRLTLHGPRHLFPEIAKQLGPTKFSGTERNELGRWSGSEAAASGARVKDSTMADLYAREGPAHDGDLAIRLRVVRLVSEFISGRSWVSCVPSQKGLVASFSFLASPESRV